MTRRKVKKKTKTNGRIIKILACCAITEVLFLSLLNLSTYYTNKRVLGATNEKNNQEQLRREAAYWERFLSKNPNYLDGWIELSAIEYSLQNKEYAIGAANTARTIDPNSKKVKGLFLKLGI